MTTKPKPPFAHVLSVEVIDGRVLLVLKGRGRVHLATAWMLPGEAVSLALSLTDHALAALATNERGNA
jgi:hypothetical protein